MKILIVSSFLPFPLHSGGHIRLYNLIKRLSKNNEITLVCEKRSWQAEEDVAEVRKICKQVITIPRKKQWSISNIVSSGLSDKSFLITGHTLSKMRSEISRILDTEGFDLIHAETSYVFQNIPKTNLPIIVAEHNIEYDVYRKYQDRAKFFLKPLLGMDIMKLKAAEEKVWKNASSVIAVSEKDKKIIEGFNKNVHMVPNGVDVEKFKITKTEERRPKNGKTILYIGDFKWVQNRDALRFILQEIWPNLKLKAKLWVVGKSIPDDLKKLGDVDVIFDENASNDTSEIFRKADILLAPIRVGGGTSYKILEAMASGVPVVTTSLGAGGIGAENNKEIIIANSEKEIIESTSRILTDNVLYKNISKNARLLIEKKYNWDNIAESLQEVYKSLI